MLTKADLGQIQKMITTSLGEFFEKVLAPYLDGQFRDNEKEHNGILQRLKENDEDHEEIFRKLDRNQDEHDQMFVKLDSIDKKVDGHETRIKNLEKTLQTS